MQTLQDNFFFHSNSRLGAEGGLENEKQLLVEEQKLCRSRARRFSLETNKRRKALEERQKQWDKQEQRLRENILQQRRQRVQDATERFQRAHLPPSQRRRQSVRRNVPNIEDALNQIQGALGSYKQQSSLLSSTSNSRSCTPSPKPPTLSKYTQRQALSAVEAYTKLLQEQSMTCLKMNPQTEKAPEKHQDHSPQDSHLSDCCYSESLSSKDSLENEDPNHTSLQCSYSSLLIDIEKPNQDLRKQNVLCPSSDLTPFSAMTLLGDNQSNKLHESKQKKQEDSETLNNKTHISNVSWGFPSVGLTQKTEPALNKCNLLTLGEMISESPEHFAVNFTRNSPNNNTVVTNRVAPIDTALKSVFSEQEGLLDVRKQRVHDEIQLKHPSATEILLPAKNINSKDLLSGDPAKQNIFLNNTASEKRPVLQTESKCCNLLSKTEHSAPINNLNKVSNSEQITEKSINSALMGNACLCNIQSNTLNFLECPKEEIQNVPVPVPTVGTSNSVRLIKGILKKQSKYMSGDATCVYGPGHVVFAKQVALAIRDSVELTKVKTEDVEGTNTAKKKLRWFDEVHVGKEDKNQDMLTQKKDPSSSLPQSKNYEDHQLSLTTVSGASRSGPNMTPPASTGYHFTKHAWADVGVQVSLPHGQAEEVKVCWSSTRTGGLKLPWRERSARAGAGPVSSRARKGTVMRPQSATEVSRIAKTQGKIMTPRPPPRMASVEEKPPYINKTPYGVDQASVTTRLPLKVDLTPHKDNSEAFFSPCSHQVVKPDSTVVCTLLQPSYTCPVSEEGTKRSPSSGPQGPQGNRRGRGVVHTDQGLRLDFTPTDEEISLLWHGVRSALATKDAKNMLRRQTLESGRGVRKPVMEQSRQPPGSGNRRFPLPSQPSKQTTEPVRSFSSAHNDAFSDEGLESAAQLHIGEVQAEGPLAESGNVAVMETAQTQRPERAQQRSQQQGLTTISLEEQRILLSLERLNHQLYSVREHIRANTGTQGLGVTDAPSTKESKVASQQKRRASSANNRPRYPKKV